MKSLVLDSWPIMEWIKNDGPAAARLEAILEDATADKITLRMSAINVGEVYYHLAKTKNRALALDWRQAAYALPVTVEVPTADDIWAASEIKSLYPVSYADAFAAALAIKYNCAVLTGDPEFRSIPHLEIDWIGP